MNEQCPTYTATIFVAGDLATARQVCREFCYEVGLCVTVSATLFIYRGGEEDGAQIGLINYPRFPAEREAIRDRAFELAGRLREAMCQHSWLVIDPEVTFWDSLYEKHARAS